MVNGKYKQFLDGHELHEQFKMLAPASLKHCQNVAELCKSVASELPEDEIDIDLLFIAALYHDVGKMLQPQYYIENQGSGDNPHDKLDPYVSYQLITRHVSDSAALLAMHGFPLDVIQVVLQHHGNSVTKPFRAKAKNADKEHFRYKWPVPQSNEAAILMVVDVIEAAARAMYNSDKVDRSQIKKKLMGLIEELIEDDQIGYLRVKHLKRIKEVITRELETIYHDRMDYPDDVLEETKEDA
jgi:cyclic-di-AMP phosphodiesterase PgpH